MVPPARPPLTSLNVAFGVRYVQKPETCQGDSEFHDTDDGMESWQLGEDSEGEHLWNASLNYKRQTRLAWTLKDPLGEPVATSWPDVRERTIPSRPCLASWLPHRSLGGGDEEP